MVDVAVIIFEEIHVVLGSFAILLGDFKVLVPIGAGRSLVGYFYYGVCVSRGLHPHGKSGADFDNLSIYRNIYSVGIFLQEP